MCMLVPIAFICPSYINNMPLSTFYPFFHFQLYNIYINEGLKGICKIRLRFRYYICKIWFALNPLNLRNLSSFIRLIEAYNIDY
jgi:hypothetical protein